jgi:hypothetical protein
VRQNARRFDNSESRCAVQSSALSDGMVWLQQGSTRTVAAQFSIGATEPHHRHSCVIGLHRSAARHRQDSVRSVVVDLHRVSSAVAELHSKRCAHRVIALQIRGSCSCAGLEQVAFLGGGARAHVRSARSHAGCEWSSEMRRVGNPITVRRHGDRAGFMPFDASTVRSQPFSSERSA